MNEQTSSRNVGKELLKPASAAAPMFDHERLDVYQLELEFIGWVTNLIEEVSKQAKGKTAEVCDQLDRASLSALLNTAEGNGKRQRQVRAKFFDDARGSATECAGCLDALVAKRASANTRILEGKAMLVRVVSMLCRLVERFETTGQLREEGVTDTIPFPPDPGKVSYKTSSRTRARTKI